MEASFYLERAKRFELLPPDRKARSATITPCPPNSTPTLNFIARYNRSHSQS